MSTIEPRLVKAKDGRPLSVRCAEPHEAQELIDFVLGILRDGEGMARLPEEFTMTPETERAWIEEMRQHPDRLVLVAELDGRLVGMLDFKAEVQKRLSHTGVLGMSVGAEVRSQGVGRTLLETLIEWAEAHPRLEKLDLLVRADNERALGLYRKLGFVEEGRRVRAIRLEDGHYVDDVLMARKV